MRKQDLDELKKYERLEGLSHDQEQAASAYRQLLLALNQLELSRPLNRGEIDRRYAVTITEVEKAIAYFKHWMMDDEFINR